MKRLYSIRKLQRAIVLFFFLPLFLLQLLQSTLSLQVLSEEISQNGKNIIHLYQTQLDTSVNRIASSIANYWAWDYNHNRMLYKQEDFASYVYSYYVMDEYRSMMTVEPIVGAMFLVSKPNNLVRSVYDDAHISFTEKQKMEKFVDEIIESWDEEEIIGWQPVQIGDRFFLMRIFRTQEAATVCFINLDQTITLNDPNYDLSNAELLYADIDGKILDNDFPTDQVTLQRDKKEPYFSGKYFVVQNYSSVSGVYMVYLEMSPLSFRKLNQIFVGVFASSIMVMGLASLLFWVLKRGYLKPMQKMDKTLQKIRQGQIEIRFDENQHVEELKQLSVSFNEMMDNLKDLRIEAYEKELRYQYAQLQYLQLQISPHFFLNILKTLYGMAQSRNYLKIQHAILMISDHVRYIFHDNKDMVTLQTELHHVENYVNMQRYVTSHVITLDLEIDPGLEEALVPALCLQTFVENSCKYAILPERELNISIQVRNLPSDDGDKLDMIIRDNGPGLSEQLLKEYNEIVQFEYREDHIGIRNIRQRIQLLYGEECGFACCNLEPGTEFELIIPVKKNTEIDTKEEQL